jgi:hypothetical protein
MCSWSCLVRTEHSTVFGGRIGSLENELASETRYNVRETKVGCYLMVVMDVLFAETSHD